VSPRPRLSAAETDDHARRLVEAAFRVVAATGDASPSVREILREAGLSRQAFYRCFASKDELMVSVLGEGKRILAEYLTVRVARARTPEEKVRAWVSGVMRQAQAPYAVERTRPFIVGPSGPGWDDDADDTERALSRPLEDAISAGVGDGSWASADPAAAALVIHDFVFASMRRHLQQDQRPSRDDIARLAEFALRGLGAPIETGLDLDVTR
jgi:AcrR family transcriptional regulator